jgi:GT2 family glycosyltransferase/tetratricopeptide (TPR) repeat protein
MPKFSIIIPVCNNPELTQNCIESIQENSENYEIIVVDNGSEPAYRGVGEVIRNDKNKGFPKAVNQGIKKATGDIIVILNNDTRVSPNWLQSFENHLQSYDIVGPCTNNISGVQCVKILEGIDYPDYDIKANQFHIENEGQSMPLHRLVYFCVAIKREVINKIGYLDEIFSPGNFEDDDYCLRAIQAGFRCGMANDILIWHKGSATHKSLNIAHQELIDKNQKIFNQKWGVTRQIVLADLNVRQCKPKTDEKFPTLALVMICRNEEKGLANAILSARGIVDHVCVSVDDSSTDNTREVANLWADEVKTYKWADNFAGARNEAHKGIKTDYIIFLDGHEYIKKGDKIKEHLKSGGDSFLCTVELDNDAVIRNPRIYKNGIQFEGKVHELQKNIHPKRAYDIVVRHDRINGQDKKSASIRDEQRDDQIGRIMGEQLEQNPKNGRAAFHLALHYQTKQQWKKAIEMQKQFLKISQVKPERWYVYFNKAFCHLALNQPFRAWLSAINADKETPERWETAKLKGLILYNKKNFRKAGEFFVESLSVNHHDEAYKPWGREISGTWNLIGECLFHQGMYWQAGEAFRKAVENSSDEKFKDLMTRRSDLMFEIAKSVKNNA